MCKVFTSFCPNCGIKIQGIMDEKGGARLYCDRCHVVMYSKIVTPKKIKLEVTKK